MAPTKFINFLAVVSFAVFYISLTPIPANALVVERAHVARNLNYAHAGIARKKRDDSSKRCKPRPTHSTHTHSSEAHIHTTHSSHHSSSTSKHHSHPTSSPHHSTSKSHTHPATTSTSSSHPAVSPDVSTSGIVGLAWSNNEQHDLCKWKTSHTKLIYNWKLEKYVDVDPAKCGFEFMAMVWGPNDAPRAAEILVEGYAKWVMLYNEPDISSQSALAVNEAVKLFFQYIAPLENRGYKFLSPACTNSPKGRDWITSFVKQVRQQGGNLHGICTHYYGTQVADFKHFMTGFMALFPDDDIYLTEFAAEDYSGNGQQLNAGEIETFLLETTAWMRAQSQIKVYMWFGAMSPSETLANNVNPANSLMGDGGGPNALGKLYLNP